MAESYSFGKQQRLLSASDYSPVFEKASVKVSNKTILILARENTLNSARLGLVVSKKNVPHAVQRNRVKRLVRESFRQQPNLPGVDIVFLSRRGIADLSNVQIASELKQLWAALIKRANRSQGKQHESRQG